MTLDKLNLTKVILSLLCTEENRKLNPIIPHLLKLSNKMLTEAISTIQTQFYEEFQNNKCSIRLFERMYGLISRNIFVYFRHHERFAEFSQVDKAFLRIDGKSIDVQEEVIKLIKAFCENHNRNLQLYMIEQKNLIISWNMLEVLISYLDVLINEISEMLWRKTRASKQTRNLLPDKQKEEKEKMVYLHEHSILILRALSETCQGPCSENQEVISYSRFFNIAEKIMNIRFIFADSQSEGEAELSSNYMLTELKNECGILLLSLMEKRVSDDSLVTLMKQNISETCLLYNMRYIYYAFTREEGGDFTEELLFPVKLPLIDQLG